MLIATPTLVMAQTMAGAKPAPTKAAPDEWGVSLGAGGVQRSDAGKVENGSRLQLGFSILRAPDKVGTIDVKELSISFAQMNTSAGTYAVRENSVELNAIADMVAMVQGAWHIDGGLGVVLSSSFGCATNGSTTAVAGSIACVHSYANSGNTKVGVRGRVVSAWSGPITTAFVGLELTGNTIAAGKTVVPGFFIGARYSMGPF